MHLNLQPKVRNMKYGYIPFCALQISPACKYIALILLFVELVDFVTLMMVAQEGAKTAIQILIGDVKMKDLLHKEEQMNAMQYAKIVSIFIAHQQCMWRI